MTVTGWHPDVLGTDFDAMPVRLPGGDRSTVVRYSGPVNDDPQAVAAGTVVLYVHGWSDYFFHTRLAEYFAGIGAAFYAVDLRNYGRNLDPDDPQSAPGYITELADYDEEFDAALELIRQDLPHAPLILSGHSTGGLTCCLWAQRHPGEVAALVLNSPWLEFQLDAAARKIITPLLGLRNRTAAVVPLKLRFQPFYARGIAEATGGHVPYDTRWKPPAGFPIFPGWLQAVFAGHEQVARGLDLSMPVLVLLSTKSVRHRTWSEEMTEADVVIDVDVVARRAVSLGADLTISRIPEALHDIFLSPSPVQDIAYEKISRFLRGALPAY